MIVAYARVSTDKQDAENQRYEIERFLARQERSIDEFVAETISGRKSASDRELGRLIDRLGPGDTLITSEISRLSRRLEDIYMILRQLLDHGVEVIVVKQNYVFEDNLQSKVMAFAFGLAAEIERELISARTKEGLALKRHQGVKLGRPPGTWQQHHYKLHGKDAEIQKLLDAHVSMSAISRLLGVNRKTLMIFVRNRELAKKWPNESGV